MKILVTGANGFLGQHLCLHLDEAFSVAATGRGESRIPHAFSQRFYPVDLTHRAAVASLVAQVQPDVIVHTAAMSKPDECNLNREACLLHNVEATRFLLEAGEALSTPAHFIYVSTDFVHGEGGPHDEMAEPAPLNFYGESKLMAERLVAATASFYTIMRPVFIYGPVWEGMRPGFIQWVKNSLEQGKAIKVVSDQLRTPTHVNDICKGLESIIRLKKYGIYNLGGGEIVSPYQMAVAVADALQLDKALIEPVTADTFKEPVKRAKLSGLLIDKAREQLNYEPVSFERGILHSLGVLSF
ncbi:SDR family oxidoreductase [Filimonas effusa]|uniref:SDR family oxidoreductase n=1 Tax=Filimonas effusa TaxID=2508721 RepID=A0A4Q1DAT6_9BACT|nr:SDR family oxidoreductase [Filimonas effusa]RXK85599.1 SDR family oxidoreductase [Filimonas effusa]